MIKAILVTLSLAAVFPAGSAKAQMYDPSHAVCMHVYGELEGERMDCIFNSLTQCTASASGRAATCLVNPYFEQRSSRPRR